MADAAMAPVIVREPESGKIPEVSWSLGYRILFRFVFSYFVLYSLPDTGRISIVNGFPGASYVTSKYIAIWHTMCPWVAIHLFHLSGQPTTYFPTGSGDTTLDYVQNLLFVVISLVAALVWSLADYKRRDYVSLDAWLRLLVRYTLSFTLLGYGLVKVFPLQFGPPGLLKLLEPYGDFSPMGALWWFMGASLPYIVFSGMCEVLAGLLLLFRRTTTLGALMAFVVMLNVAVLNYAYDVPVKLYSTNLVLMAVFLASRDLRRLCNFFLLNRATAPGELTAPRFERRWLRVGAVVFQVVFVGYYLLSEIGSGWAGYRARYLHPQRPPLYGIYEVKTFVRNGQELPPLVTDGTRWRKLVVQSQTGFNVKMMDDAVTSFGTEYDAAKSAVNVTIGADKTKKYQLAYSRPDPDHLQLDGKLGQDTISVKAQKIDPASFRLLSRGFHWINETPFNR